MKAIVSFIRSTTILKKVPIVQKTINIDTGARRNFDDKAELVDFINSMPPPQGYDTVMYVKCGCNREFIYPTFNDIPADNLTCVCSQLVIVYGQ